MNPMPAISGALMREAKLTGSKHLPGRLSFIHRRFSAKFVPVVVGRRAATVPSSHPSQLQMPNPPQ